MTFFHKSCIAAFPITFFIRTSLNVCLVNYIRTCSYKNPLLTPLEIIRVNEKFTFIILLCDRYLNTITS